MPARDHGWIAMFLALSVSTAGAAVQCRLVSSPSIPVTVVDWRPTIPAELDGHQTRLLVDTGAFFDALSPAEATEFKLPLSSAPHGFYVMGGLGNLYPKIATVEKLRLGPLSFGGDAKFLVIANDLGNGISGVLGQNLYKVLDVEFDFADGAMRFFTPSHCGGQPLAYWANTTGQPVSVLDLQPRDPTNAHLLGAVMVNGHAVNVIFDTGAPTSMLSLAAAKLVGVPPGSAGVTAVGTSGRLWSAPIDEIDLGDNEKVRHTHILVSGSNFSFGYGEWPYAWMFIGADFFLSHRVYLATSQSKLYFTYNGGPVFDLNPEHAAGGGLGTTTTANLRAGTPVDADGLMRRGLVHANQLEFQEAIAELTQACLLAPKNADYRYRRGVVYWRDAQPGLALADFNAAVGLDPNDFRARLWRAEVRLVSTAAPKPDPKSNEDPRIESSIVDRPPPENSGPSQSAAPGPADAGAIDDAKTDLDAVDRLAPPEADLRLTLGRVYEDIGQYAQSIHQYDLWIAYHPADYRLAMALTWRCGSRGLGSTAFGQALKDCNGAYDLMGISWWTSRPKWPPSWAAALLSTRGLIELRQGELVRATGDDTAAIKLEPGDPYALYTRGLAELHQGLKTQGQSDLTAASKLQPGIDHWYAGMGLTP
jgi:tetratricopeptide (TPR) repeat protein/predicted aspartyl protease